MNNIKKIEQTDKIVDLFKMLITRDYNPETIVDMLDELIIKHSMFLINEDTSGYSNRADGLFLLHELKCICQAKDLSKLSA